MIFYCIYIYEQTTPSRFEDDLVTKTVLVMGFTTVPCDTPMFEWKNYFIWILNHISSCFAIKKLFKNS